MFEVSEEDLLFFSKYHDAGSVQASRNASIIDKVGVGVVELSKGVGEESDSTLYWGSNTFFVFVLFLLFTNQNLRGSVELCSVSNFHSELHQIKQALPL